MTTDTTNVVYDIAALIAYLSQNTDIVTDTAGRIYGNEMPNEQAAFMPRGLIVINSAGTARMTRDRLNLGHKIFDVRCYHSSMYLSSMLFLSVAKHLKNLQRQLINGVLLYDASQITGRFTAREPDTEWPVSYGSFEVTISEEGIP